MKIACARIITNDVTRLARFYQELTGKGLDIHERYAPTPAFSGPRATDLQTKGATVSESGRWVLLDFEVEDVDEERARLHNIVSEFALTTQPATSRAVLFRDGDGNLIKMFTVAWPTAQA